MLTAARAERVRDELLRIYGAGVRVRRRRHGGYDEGEGVAACRSRRRSSVLLTSADGQCIRFAVTSARMFQGAPPWACTAWRLAGRATVISL